MDPKSLDISLQQNLLSISGERKIESPENAQFYRQERFSGGFRRVITLKADLPGVSRDRLEIKVEGNDLSIDGWAEIDMPKGMEALHADVGTTRFGRHFTLSNELETDKISAEIKDGVLTLQLPKRAELQPRKIEVSVA